MILVGGAAVILSSCSSGPKSAPIPDGEPTWVHQAARTVDGGYIIYVAASEDRTLDRAQMKAQAAAIQDVANECSFAPKGTRLEDRYDNTLGILHRAYAKVAISYQDCEEAQKATSPEDVKRLANVAFTEEVKRYQDAIDKEVVDGSNNPDNEGVNPALANTAVGPTGPIRDNMHFFVVRQQIAYAKEIVILAPPAAYAPGSPQTVQYVQAVQPAAMQIQNYRTQNPATQYTPQSWSSLPSKPAVPALAGMHMRSSPPRVRGLSPMLTAPVRGTPSGYVNRKSGDGAGGGKGRGRRRRRPNPEQ